TWVHKSHYESTWLTKPEDKLKVTVDEARRLQPNLPHGAKVLFLNDLFELDESWKTKGLLQLSYHDHDLQVDTANRMNPKPKPEDYAYVFESSGENLVQLNPSH